jgi:FMN phosphatase YigB (HAD superfamily)
MKKIVYIDMDNVLVDFKTGIDKLDQNTIDKYQGKLDEVPGIFSLMKP